MATVYEKGPHEENICFLKNIYFFKKQMFFGTYIFRKVPSRTWRIREGAVKHKRQLASHSSGTRHMATVYEKGPHEENICFLKNIYFFKKQMFFGTYIFRKVPSRTWRIREGASRARMCALVTFKFSRVTN